MSHEFEVHHLVSQLVALLKVQDTGSVDSFVELLLKNRTSYVTPQVSVHASKRKLAEFSSKGEQFLSKYDELKIKQTRDLNPLVFLLAKVTEDSDLCGFLAKTRPPVQDEDRRRELGGPDVKVLDIVEGQEVALPEKGAVLSEKELDELRGKLETVATTMQERGKPKDTAPPSHFPKLPAWLNERVYLTRDFVIPATPTSDGGVALGSLPVAMQQQAILEDLLNVMMGMDGRYIHAEALSPSTTYRTFSVDPALDLSLRTLVKRVLPIASHYSIVQRFIEERSKFIHGMINQGLCSSMRGLLKEYLVIVSQLESQQNTNQLSLQKLWYYVQPCMKTLQILSHVVVSISSGMCRGGKTLTNLHNLTSSYIGDERSQEVCLTITQAACKPYFSMLHSWVYQGVVLDPYAEFMITEHEAFQKDRLHEEYNDSYWERRYTVNQENIPSFLEHIAEKILRTGKYLNVVRECGVEVACPDASGVSYTIHERQYVEQIDKAYTYASKELLQLMIRDQDLLGHLHSMKHCFLLDQGDLLVHFMDMAEEELTKPMADILPQRLESLMELAVRTSLLDNDPYKDNLRPLLVPYDLVTQLFYILAIQPEGVGRGDDETPPPITRPDPSTVGLSGLEAFSLDYHVGWPLSLVISRKCLFKYQMLFRHLFSCKHVERQLCATWTRHKQAKRFPLLAHPWYASAYALLQRMLNFVQNLQYYMTFEVLEPNWALLEKNLRSVNTIDDVLTAHGDFLDRSLRDCLLSDREVLKIVSRLMAVCISFTDYLQKAGSYLSEVSGRQVEAIKIKTRVVPKGTAKLPSGEVFEGGADPHKLRSRLLSTEVDETSMSESFEENISKLDDGFTRDLVLLLDKLYEVGGNTVGGMVSRLDFNGFYKDHMTSHDTN